MLAETFSKFPDLRTVSMDDPYAANDTEDPVWREYEWSSLTTASGTHDNESISAIHHVHGCANKGIAVTFPLVSNESRNLRRSLLLYTVQGYS